MCGRTCLTLNPDEIIQACKYRNSSAKKENDQRIEKIKKELSSEGSESVVDESFVTPSWRAEFNCGRSFVPSYNIAPTDICPVLASSSHFLDEQESTSNKRVIVPMMWGMIPFWHRGDYRKHGLTTNNCRLENLLKSKMYSRPLELGQRCVILCEGFYEWQTTKGGKPSERAPYFIYAPQKQGICIYDRETWTSDNINLLKLAGLFDIWENDEGDKIFSYSVITFEATELTSWLHHRMPAILETEQQISDWLDFNRVSKQESLKLLRPATQIFWHRVANTVNNSRNKSSDCNKPVEIAKPIPQNKIMLSWLKKRKLETDTDEKSDDAHNSKQDVKRPCN